MSVKFGDNNINPNIGNPTLEATIAKPSVNISFNAPAINAKGKGTVILENPQFFIGNVETLDAGEDVYCYLTGTRDAPVLNFGIPMGFKGDTGAAATIAVGTVTTGQPTDPASVTNSGTSSAAVFDFVIPKGADGTDGVSPTATVSKVGDTATITITDKNGTTTASISDGQNGQDGQDGAAATIAVGTTSTGAAGTSASVTNVGTSSAAVFDFVIPKGDTGATGQGVPSGGSAGQVLKKVSGTDYDTEWATDEAGATPDWEEDDSSDPSYIENKPAIKAGTGTYAVVLNNTAENVASGNLAIVGGSKNTVTGELNIVGGVSNYVSGRRNVVVGDANRVEGRRSFVAGSYTHTGGSGSNGIAVGTPFGQQFKLTGAANATTYTYDSLPATVDIASFTSRKLAVYYSGIYALVTSLDTANNSITLDKTLSATAISAENAQIFIPQAILHSASAVIGKSVQSTRASQLVVGELNALDANALFMVGNGDPEDGVAQNAFVVHEDGTANFQSTASAGTVATPATVTSANDLTTKAYVDAAIPTVPTKVSAFTNDAGYLTSYTETDPTVPSWAKQITKPSYTASEVGALADTTKYALSASVGGSAKTTEGIPFGEVASTSTSTAFTATVAGITELKDGTVVMLKNGVVTSASGFTIDINNLGAKPVYSSMATGNDVDPKAPTRETTIFNINYTLLLVYSTDLVEGGAWINYRGYNSDNNTIGYQIRTNSYSLPMDSVTYRYRLLFTSADGTKFVPANNSTSTNATASRTVCQSKIDPFGAIVYYGTTTAVAAGSRPGAAYLWSQYTIALGYSFNSTGAALTMTAWKPVYVKAVPQTDGSAIMDSTTPYVQDLPSTSDGKIYIFLGVAYSATNIELLNNHPVYYHDGTAIRLWTGKAIPTKTSELSNDSGFITSAPVTSVNGQTGAVVVSVLPAVTSSDNGKVLRVVNGAWAAENLPSANGVSF